MSKFFLYIFDKTSHFYKHLLLHSLLTDVAVSIFSSSGGWSVISASPFPPTSRHNDYYQNPASIYTQVHMINPTPCSEVIAPPVDEQFCS